MGLVDGWGGGGRGKGKEGRKGKGKKRKKGKKEKKEEEEAITQLANTVGGIYIWAAGRICVAMNMCCWVLEFDRLFGWVGGGCMYIMLINSIVFARA